MSSYLDQLNSRHRHTPQSEPIPGSGQVPNSAGGYAWDVDDWTRLQRFMILGSEGGSYYAGERELTMSNYESVRRCIQHDGPRVVREVLDISVNGRAPKQDPAILVLALCASAGLGEGETPTPEDDATRAAALAAVPLVCRYGTTLFMFVRFCKQHRGWGRGLRNAIAAWYTEPHPNTARRADGEEVADSHVNWLAYQAVKYRQRDGFTHRDLLRLSHPQTDDATLAALLAWMADKAAKVPKREDKNETMPKGWRRSPFPSSVIAYEAAQKATNSADICKLLDIFGNKLPREAIPDEFKDKQVWNELVANGMPMGTLVRNLATMTRLDALTPNSEATQTVLAQLGDKDAILRARIHPIAVLSAMLTYASGRSARGQHSWSPLPKIVDALDAAFYHSFGNVEATGKRWLLGLDVSGSMDGGQVSGVLGLTPRVASSAMAMVTAATGDDYEVVAFTSSGASYDWRRSTTLSVLPISNRQRLDDICAGTKRLNFGGTDCALPMLYAAQQNREFDVFAIYTDSETWHGNVHPSQALRDYRVKSGIDAKLIVVGMVSNGFTIADPKDPGMLDVVGFDTATPSIMESFVRG